MNRIRIGCVNYCCRYMRASVSATTRFSVVGGRRWRYTIAPTIPNDDYRTKSQPTAEDRLLYANTMPDNPDDLPMVSRISNIEDEMLERKDISIRSISDLGFRLSDRTFLYGAIAAFPKAVISWRILTPDDIHEQSLQLFLRLEPKLDVFILGVGDGKYVDSVRRRVAPILRKYKIPFEIQRTEDAVPIFNELNYEGRYVAAGLYPPDEFVVFPKQQMDAVELLCDRMDIYRVAEEHKRIDYAYAAHSIDKDRDPDIVKSLWGNDNEALNLLGSGIGGDEAIRRRQRELENRYYRDDNQQTDDIPTEKEK